MRPRNQTRKIDKIHIDFQLSLSFMYNFLCQTVLIFPIDYSQYIINIPNISFTKWIESLHFGLEISVLYYPVVHFESQITNKIHKMFWNISSIQEPNCSNIPNIYYSQKESTYFSEGVLGHFGPQKSDKKNP